MIYVNTTTRQDFKIRSSVLQTAVWAEFLTTGYERYSIQIEECATGLGWAHVDGQQLRQARDSGKFEFTDYASAFVFKDGDYYFNSRLALPRFMIFIETLFNILRVNKFLFGYEQRKLLGRPKILVRSASIHRQGWRYVLKGAVVMNDVNQETAAETIRLIKRSISKKVSHEAKSVHSRFSLIRHLALGYTRISVFGTDYRRRRLRSFGLKSQLICTIQIKKIACIKAPDIFGSTIEVSGRWRIAWNKAWLESGGIID